MARFMNHSCEPNAYAKVICTTTNISLPGEIMVSLNKYFIDIHSIHNYTYVKMFYTYINDKCF
jgi:hypothetical protein